MTNISLEKLHTHLLTSLIAFNTYCRNHDIKYSLCGGTLIGAVRHQGFIPWDDDTDVMMTRSEYNKLTETWIADPLPGYTLLTDHPSHPAYAGESGKWYATNTAPRHPKNDYDIGLFMDIFIADGLPDDKKTAQKHFKIIHHQGHSYRTSYKHRHHPFFKLLYLIYPPYRPQSIWNHIKKLLHRYPDTTAHQLALILGSGRNYSQELIPKHYFDHFVELSFEGHTFPAIAEYDAYLRHYYGDYMQLPPEKEQIPSHPQNHHLKI